MPRSSNKREEILRFLSDFSAQNGYSPTVREICAAVGLSSTASVYRHLEALRDEGLICMDEQKKRSITVPGARPGRVPVVGMVTAFIVSVLSIKFLMRYIKTNDFKAFGWYRIVLGIIVLIYLFMVGDPTAND